MNDRPNRSNPRMPLPEHAPPAEPDVIGTIAELERERPEREEVQRAEPSRARANGREAQATQVVLTVMEQERRRELEIRRRREAAKTNPYLANGDNTRGVLAAVEDDEVYHYKFIKALQGDKPDRANIGAHLGDTHAGWEYVKYDDAPAAAQQMGRADGTYAGYIGYRDVILGRCRRAAYDQQVDAHDFMTDQMAGALKSEARDTLTDRSRGVRFSEEDYEDRGAR